MQNNLWSVSASSERSERVNKLVGEINNICDQLISAFEMSSDKVMSYGFSLAGEMDTVFVDKILNAIDKMKLHMQEIYTHMDSNVELESDVIMWLMSIQSKLTDLLVSNNYYADNFQMPISEVNHDIQKILDNVKVGEAA